MIGPVVVSFAVPLVFIVFGWLFTHGRYPRKPNALCGYRTTRSMKNEETWRYAQEHWGRLSWRYGWVLLILSGIIGIILWLLSKNGHEVMSYSVTWLVLESILTLGTILPVERALKDRFDEFGRRRSA